MCTLLLERSAVIVTDNQIHGVFVMYVCVGIRLGGVEWVVPEGFGSIPI